MDINFVLRHLHSTLTLNATEKQLMGIVGIMSLATHSNRMFLDTLFSAETISNYATHQL